VTVVVAGAAVALAVKVRTPDVDDAPIVTGATVTPVGRPSTAMATSPVKPPESVSATVAVPFAPCWTLTVAGDRAMAIVAEGFVLSSSPHAVSVAVATTTDISLRTSSMPTCTTPSGPLI